MVRISMHGRWNGDLFAFDSYLSAFSETHGVLAIETMSD